MLHVLDMGLSGLLAQTANVHVFHHPLAQLATLFSVMGASCLMVEKAPIVRQVSQIARYAPLRAAHANS